MSFQEKVKALMKEKKLTQKELSKKLRVTESAVSQYLSGNRTPRRDIVVNCARIFNVSVDYLLGVELKVETPFNQLSSLIARNSKELTPEEKNRLIKLILGGDK